MRWRIECKHSGCGFDFSGSLDEAVCRAQAECVTDFARYVVWIEPANFRMAEVTSDGVSWIKTTLRGEEVVKLMRRHHKTISQLSFLMGIPQKRIREIRTRGLLGKDATRDWLQAIIGDDVGPLPDRYRISRRDQEGECCYCGTPLFIGDAAFEYANGCFCSITCARNSRKPVRAPQTTYEYRAVYYDAAGRPKLILPRDPSEDCADVLTLRLENIVASGHATGGHLEALVSGIGWVVCD